MRTKEIAIQKTEEILRKVTEDFYMAWEQKVKGTKFSLIGYMVCGGIFILQVFDDGGAYHFLGVDSLRWDVTEDRIIEHYKSISGSKIKTSPVLPE